jgi:PEP-CTERM motif
LAGLRKLRVLEENVRSFFVVLSVLVPLSLVAGPMTTIDFDTSPCTGATNNVIGTTCETSGISASGLKYVSGDMGGAIDDNTVWAAFNGGSSATIDFVDPANLDEPAVVDWIELTNLGLVNSADDLDGLTVTAYDLNGDQVGSPIIIAPVGPTATSVGTTWTITGAGIHELQFTRISNTPSGAAGFDDLSYTDLAGVPEPTTFVLCAAGLGLFGIVRRRFYKSAR